MRPPGVNVAVWVATLLAASALAGCSHREPYFRSDTRADEASSGRLRSRIILVGDAGEIDASVLEHVSTWAGHKPDNTIVLYLGDNMYPEGMTLGRRREADRRLLPQIRAVTKVGSRLLFVPGNHDWADGGKEGYEAILEQAAYVNSRLDHPDGFLPRNGCPGPVAIDPFDNIRIVALDTQWWLHQETKPFDTCPYRNPKQIGDALSSLLNTERDVIVAAHHPLFGYGRHSGFSSWSEYLFPPLVGSVIALVRKLAPRDQDYRSAQYQDMVEFFGSAMSRSSRPDGLLLWAAGHEHNLQVLEGMIVDYVLISGSAANVAPVSHGEETLFALERSGFMSLDFMESGQVLLQVVQPDVGVVFSEALLRL